MANNPLRAREKAPLHLRKAGWYCPVTFQPNQNKQRTRSEENLKQTFGSHLSMGSYEGNSALKFRTWIVYGKNMLVSKTWLLFNRVVCRKSGERLCSATVQHWYSRWDACKQGVLIKQEQVIQWVGQRVQSKLTTVILSWLQSEQTCIDVVVGVKWTRNKGCCVLCESFSKTAEAAKWSDKLPYSMLYFQHIHIDISSLWFINSRYNQE